MGVNMETYLNGLEASKEVRAWAASTLKNYQQKHAPTQTEVEHVLDYLCSKDGPAKLRRMSYPQAKAKAEAWTKAQQKKGAHIEEKPDDVELVHEFSDGSRIVQLIGANAFKREGYLMRHCVGSYTYSETCLVYSYRDVNNQPHATIELQKQGDQISQIKGKGNGPIHPRYIDFILAFLKTVGVKVRPSEMKNLGYWHVSEELSDYIGRSYVPAPNYVLLYGERYLYEAS